MTSSETSQSSSRRVGPAKFLLLLLLLLLFASETPFAGALLARRGDAHVLPRGRTARRSSSSSSSSLQKELETAFSLSPYLDPSLCSSTMLAIDNDLNYSSDVVTFRGYAEYATQARDYQKFVLPSLRGGKFNLERVSALSPTSYTCNWNVSFVADGVGGLSTLAELLPVLLRAEYFNILDREQQQASFSWAQLRSFFSRAFSTGVLRLPHAVIKGQTDVTLRPPDVPGGSFSLVKHKESLLLLRSLRSGSLKNRVLVLHLLEYASASRPQSISFGEWEDILAKRVDVRLVPGMRQFDIDGLEGEQQQELLQVSGQVLGYATGVVLLFGVAFATAVLDKLTS